MNNEISCRNCKHFYITWDQSAPNGCKAYGFKSRRIPSVVVKQESNQECMHFTKKEKKKKPGLDLDDDSLW